MEKFPDSRTLTLTDRWIKGETDGQRKKFQDTHTHPHTQTDRLLTTSVVKHGATASRFFSIKIIDSNFKPFGYNKDQLIASSFLCIYLLSQQDPVYQYISLEHTYTHTCTHTHPQRPGSCPLSCLQCIQLAATHTHMHT